MKRFSRYIEKWPLNLPPKIGMATVLVFTLSMASLARAEREKSEKEHSRVPENVTLERIGHPTWKPVDFHTFTAPVGDFSDGFAEFGQTEQALLPPPKHRSCASLGIGPGIPHGPPYDREFDAGVERNDFGERSTFNIPEFSLPNGVWAVWMNIPNSDAPQGSSPDFSKGAIIPNSVFPISVSGVALRNGEAFDPFLASFSVPKLTAQLSCPFNVDGHSHFPIFTADALEFGPAGTNPEGIYEYRIQMRDQTASGWNVSVQFKVKAHEAKIFPITSHPFGKTYGEWAAEWWQWAYEIPKARNPVLDLTGEFCDEGQSGPVWFLAGTFGGTVTRHCTVPAGKAVLCPLLNLVWVQFPTDPPITVEEIRDVLAPFMDGGIVTCEIDGRAVRDLGRYREQSSVFTVTIPSDGYRLPEGSYYPCLDDGYYLMLAPLSAGQHTIHFTGQIPAFGFSMDVTYHLTVKGHHDQDERDH